MARRPAEDLLVGIDVGTTNTKSAVFSIDARCWRSRRPRADGDEMTLVAPVRVRVSPSQAPKSRVALDFLVAG